MPEMAKRLQRSDRVTVRPSSLSRLLCQASGEIERTDVAKRAPPLVSLDRCPGKASACQGRCNPVCARPAYANARLVRA